MGVVVMAVRRVLLLLRVELQLLLLIAFVAAAARRQRPTFRSSTSPASLRSGLNDGGLGNARALPLRRRVGDGGVHRGELARVDERPVGGPLAPPA